MAFPSQENLLALVTPIVMAAGAEVEGIKTTKAGKKSVVTIWVDADIPPTTETLEKLSQEISELFDAAEARGELNFGPGYTLEVSTPGIGQPLVAPRHWRRNQGRLITLTAAGKKRTVRLGALNEDSSAAVIIFRDGKKLAIDTIELAQYPDTMVEIEFKEPAVEEMELTAIAYNDAVSQTRRED